MFASYVICSIKQTNDPIAIWKDKFASYVICSIKQTSVSPKSFKICLLVMLFVVLSKLTIKLILSNTVC